MLLIICTRPCLANEGDSICHNEYIVDVKLRHKSISGIFVMEYNPNSCVSIGTLINEFGIKAFDFSSSGKKMKIFNLIAPLDKWYIRNILKKDLHFIVERLNNIKKIEHATKTRMTMRVQNDSILFENNRYNINYSLVPMK